MSEALLDPRKEKLYRQIVLLISVLIPAVVAFLIFMPQTGKLGDLDVSAFPAIHAALNSLTAICLLLALQAIRKKNVPLHKAWMSTAFVLSACFLVCYVIYHFQGHPTRYGDLNHDGALSPAELDAAGSMRLVYFIVLATHILMAALVLPFILFSFYFSLSNQIAKHRRIVQFTWPAWFFVAVSGVLVYFMIRPYYPV
jgi:putative membrane protein